MEHVLIGFVQEIERMVFKTFQFYFIQTLKPNQNKI